MICRYLIIFVLALAPHLSFAADTKKKTTAPAASSGDSGSNKIPVPTGRYITGGVLGSILGFGIGHGVQGEGRYADKGWIFTAGGAAGLVVMLSGASSCANDRSQCGTFWLGYAIAGGFHIWEIIDVWVGARPVEKETAFLILPTQDGLQAQLAWRF